MERSSRAVVAVLELGMNLSATGPPGESASQTSAKPPRPRTRVSRYPGDGSAPTCAKNAPGVVERTFGKKVNTSSPTGRPFNTGTRPRPAEEFWGDTRIVKEL